MKLISLFIIPIVLNLFPSLFCPKIKKRPVKNEEIIFHGNKFPFLKVYFNEQKEPFIAEIEVVKLAFYDTLVAVKNNNTNNTSKVIFTGHQSKITKISDNKYLYENEYHKFKILLKKCPLTHEINVIRKRIYLDMANTVIMELKSQENYPGYKFDWNIDEDFHNYLNQNYLVNYKPIFIQKFYESKFNSENK